MAVESLTRDSARAVEHFERKLAFEMGPIELKYAIEGKEPIQVIDLRAAEYFGKGHVPGAQNILIDDLEKNFANLSKDKTTVVYCYNITCHLATKAALLLAKAGYKVKELVGGFEEWAKYELPTEAKSEAHSCSTAKGASCG